MKIDIDELDNLIDKVKSNEEFYIHPALKPFQDTWREYRLELEKIREELIKGNNIDEYKLMELLLFPIHFNNEIKLVFEKLNIY